jgi:hypothetical protein
MVSMLMTLWWQMLRLLLLLVVSWLMRRVVVSNLVDSAYDPAALSYEAKSVWVAETVGRLLVHYGLAADGWSYRENKVAKRFLGVCCHDDLRIEVSREAIRRNSVASLFNTVTHEVAHALAGFEAGHGPRWQEIHRELGGNGERRGSFESCC